MFLHIGETKWMNRSCTKATDVEFADQVFRFRPETRISPVSARRVARVKLLLIELLFYKEFSTEEFSNFLKDKLEINWFKICDKRLTNILPC